MNSRRTTLDSSHSFGMTISFDAPYAAQSDRYLEPSLLVAARSRVVHAQSTSMALHRIAQCLSARRETLACVEIGSGGRVSRVLTSEPGSSAFFAGSLILPADSAHWPQSIAGDGSWRAAPPGSQARLAGLAGVAQQSYGTDWGVAVECLPAAGQISLSIALRTPGGNTVLDTVLPAEDAVQSGEERLVECVLELLAQQLEKHREEAP